MRIYDSDHDCTTDNAVLYLTLSEAEELSGDLTALLLKPKGNHAHINSSDFQQEVTVCVYDPSDLSEFDDRSVAIIRGAEGATDSHKTAD